MEYGGIMMNCKEIPNFECPDGQCWLRDGDGCKLDLERFNELKDNDALENLKCMDSYFNMQAIRRHLENHQPQEPAKYENYQQYKLELDAELRKTTEGFVKIGYLLKVAKDTNILKESGYANVYEFAQAEYGIDKSQVSRFININDRFSEGGYSDRLKEQYQGFGHAKLAIMLQLPDEVNEELTPDFSKSEIQTLKEEYDEENRISDLEVLMEDKDEHMEPVESNLYKVLWQLGKDTPELYVKLHGAVKDGIKAIHETMAPDGERIFSVRLMGIGRMMLSLKEPDKAVTITNLRNPSEKEEFDWEEIYLYIKQLTAAGMEPEKAWETLYGEPFPAKEEKKQEVAPVQQVAEKKKETPKKETKVQKAKKPQPKKPEPKEPVSESQPESQIPGQTHIVNFPEYLPESMKQSAEILNDSSIEEPVNVTADSEIVTEIPVCTVEEQNAADSIIPAAGVEEPAPEEMQERLENAWETANMAVIKLNLFFQDWNSEHLTEGEIPTENLQNAYKNALCVAAELERILNHGKI